VSQYWPAAHAGSHVATHAPSAQISPVLHVFPAHVATHSKVVKSPLGLHACPAGQLVAVQGPSLQTPLSQNFPQPAQGTFGQVFATHLPAFGP